MSLLMVLCRARGIRLWAKCLQDLALLAKSQALDAEVVELQCCSLRHRWRGRLFSGLHRGCCCTTRNQLHNSYEIKRRSYCCSLRARYEFLFNRTVSQGA
jgi:hypothetical protein